MKMLPLSLPLALHYKYSSYARVPGQSTYYTQIKARHEFLSLLYFVFIFSAFLAGEYDYRKQI